MECSEYDLATCYPGNDGADQQVLYIQYYKLATTAAHSPIASIIELVPPSIAVAVTVIYLMATCLLY